MEFKRVKGKETGKGRCSWNLRVIIGRFVEVCERRGPKVSVIEEGVDVSRREGHEGELEHISVFKY